jgi:hypothetical protein
MKISINRRKDKQFSGKELMNSKTLINENPASVMRTLRWMKETDKLQYDCTSQYFSKYVLTELDR